MAGNDLSRNLGLNLTGTKTFGEAWSQTVGGLASRNKYFDQEYFETLSNLDQSRAANYKQGIALIESGTALRPEAFSENLYKALAYDKDLQWNYLQQMYFADTENMDDTTRSSYYQDLNEQYTIAAAQLIKDKQFDELNIVEKALATVTTSLVETVGIVGASLVDAVAGIVNLGSFLVQGAYHSAEALAEGDESYNPFEHWEDYKVDNTRYAEGYVEWLRNTKLGNASYLRNRLMGINEYGQVVIASQSQAAAFMQQIVDGVAPQLISLMSGTIVPIGAPVDLMGKVLDVTTKVKSLGQVLYGTQMFGTIVQSTITDEQFMNSPAGKQAALLALNILSEYGTEYIFKSGPQEFGLFDVSGKVSNALASGLSKSKLNPRAQSIIKGIAMIMTSAFEEGSEEVLNEILEGGFSAVIDGKSFESGLDVNSIIMAGIVGAVSGIALSGAQIFSTDPVTIKRADGKEFKLNRLDSFIFNRLSMGETVADILNHQTEVSRRAALLGISVDKFAHNTKYTESYNEAVAIDEKNIQLQLANAAVLTAALTTYGSENFMSVTEWVARNQTERLTALQNFFWEVNGRHDAISTIYNAGQEALAAEFNEANPGVTITPIKIDANYRPLANNLKDIVGVNDVIIAKVGTADDSFGLDNGWTIFGDTLIIDEDALNGQRPIDIVQNIAESEACKSVLSSLDVGAKTKEIQTSLEEMAEAGLHPITNKDWKAWKKTADSLSSFGVDVWNKKSVRPKDDMQYMNLLLFSPSMAEAIQKADSKLAQRVVHTLLGWSRRIRKNSSQAAQMVKNVLGRALSMRIDTALDVAMNSDITSEEKGEYTNFAEEVRHDAYEIATSDDLTDVKERVENIDRYFYLPEQYYVAKDSLHFTPYGLVKKEAAEAYYAEHKDDPNITADMLSKFDAFIGSSGKLIMFAKLFDLRQSKATQVARAEVESVNIGEDITKFFESGKTSQILSTWQDYLTPESVAQLTKNGANLDNLNVTVLSEAEAARVGISNGLHSTLSKSIIKNIADIVNQNMAKAGSLDERMSQAVDDVVRKGVKSSLYRTGLYQFLLGGKDNATKRELLLDIADANDRGAETYDVCLVRVSSPAQAVSTFYHELTHTLQQQLGLPDGWRTDVLDVMKIVDIRGKQLTSDMYFLSLEDSALQEKRDDIFARVEENINYFAPIVSKDFIAAISKVAKEIDLDTANATRFLDDLKLFPTYYENVKNSISRVKAEGYNRSTISQTANAISDFLNDSRSILYEVTWMLYVTNRGETIARLNSEQEDYTDKVISFDTTNKPMWWLDDTKKTAVMNPAFNSIWQSLATSLSVLSGRNYIGPNGLTTFINDTVNRTADGKPVIDISTAEDMTPAKPTQAEGETQAKPAPEEDINLTDEYLGAASHITKETESKTVYAALWRNGLRTADKLVEFGFAQDIAANLERSMSPKSTAKLTNLGMQKALRDSMYANVIGELSAWDFVIKTLYPQSKIMDIQGETVVEKVETAQMLMSIISRIKGDVEYNSVDEMWNDPRFVNAYGADSTDTSTVVNTPADAVLFILRLNGNLLSSKNAKAYMKQARYGFADMNREISIEATNAEGESFSILDTEGITNKSAEEEFLLDEDGVLTSEADITYSQLDDISKSERDRQLKEGRNADTEERKRQIAEGQKADLAEREALQKKVDEVKRLQNKIQNASYKELRQALTKDGQRNLAKSLSDIGIADVSQIVKELTALAEDRIANLNQERATKKAKVEGRTLKVKDVLAADEVLHSDAEIKQYLNKFGLSSKEKVMRIYKEAVAKMTDREQFTLNNIYSRKEHKAELISKYGQKWFDQFEKDVLARGKRMQAVIAALGKSHTRLEEAGIDTKKLGLPQPETLPRYQEYTWHEGVYNAAAPLETLEEYYKQYKAEIDKLDNDQEPVKEKLKEEAKKTPEKVKKAVEKVKKAKEAKEDVGAKIKERIQKIKAETASEKNLKDAGFADEIAKTIATQKKLPKNIFERMVRISGLSAVFRGTDFGQYNNDPAWEIVLEEVYPNNKNFKTAHDIKAFVANAYHIAMDTDLAEGNSKINWNRVLPLTPGKGLNYSEIALAALNDYEADLSTPQKVREFLIALGPKLGVDNTALRARYEAQQAYDRGEEVVLEAPLTEAMDFQYRTPTDDTNRIEREIQNTEDEISPVTEVETDKEQQLDAYRERQRAANKEVRQAERDRIKELTSESTKRKADARDRKTNVEVRAEKVLGDGSKRFEDPNGYIGITKDGETVVIQRKDLQTGRKPYEVARDLLVNFKAWFREPQKASMIKDIEVAMRTDKRFKTDYDYLIHSASGIQSFIRAVEVLATRQTEANTSVEDILGYTEDYLTLDEVGKMLDLAQLLVRKYIGEEGMDRDTRAKERIAMQENLQKAARRLSSSSGQILGVYASMLSYDVAGQARDQALAQGIELDETLLHEYQVAQDKDDYAGMMKATDALRRDYIMKQPKIKELWESGDPTKRRQAIARVQTAIQAFRYMALLSKPTVDFRNFGSNTAIMAVDRTATTIASWMEKRLNEQKVFKSDYSYLRHGEMKQSAKDFVKEHYVDNGAVDFRIGGSKYSVAGTVADRFLYSAPFGYKDGKPTAMQKFYDWRMSMLDKGDQFFVKREAIRLLQNTINNVADPSKLNPDELKLILDKCVGVAMATYMRNPNAFSKFAKTLQQKNPIMGALFSVFVPFPKIAWNMMRLAYEFSPLGLLNVAKEYYHQKLALSKTKIETDFFGKPVARNPFVAADVSKTIAKSTLGTMMAALGCMFGALGWIDYDEDKYAMVLDFGLFRVSLDILEPAFTTFLLTATWFNKDIESSYDRFKLFFDQFIDATAFAQMESLLNYNDSVLDVLAKLPADVLGQFVPSFIKAISKVVDPATKEYRGMDAFTKSMLRLVNQAIPGLSYATPNQYNPYTGAVKGRDSSGIANAFFSLVLPLNIYWDKEKSAFEYEMAVLQKLGISGTQTTGLSGTFAINGVQRSLNRDERAKYSQARAKVVDYLGTQLINSRAYARARDKYINAKSEKAKAEAKKELESMVSKVYTKASLYTKVYYWTETSTDTVSHRYAFTNVTDMKDYSKIFSRANVYVNTDGLDTRFITKKR